jgi:hypothetical protein
MSQSNLSLDDQYVDLLARRFDLAIRSVLWSIRV